MLFPCQGTQESCVWIRLGATTGFQVNILFTSLGSDDDVDVVSSTSSLHRLLYLLLQFVQFNMREQPSIISKDAFI